MELIARRLPLFYSQIHNRQDCSQWSSQRTSNKTDMKLFHTSAYRNGATANGRTEEQKAIVLHSCPVSATKDSFDFY